MPSLDTHLSFRLMPVALFKSIFCGTPTDVMMTIFTIQNTYQTRINNKCTNDGIVQSNDKQQMIINVSVTYSY